CVVGGCESGWADCNGVPGDGCEADLSAPSSCGICGTTCGAGNVCTPSGCAAACMPPQTDCGGACLNLATDPRHCGSWMSWPSASLRFATCTGGICGQGGCWPGLTSCSNPTSCVDLQKDPLNCGACGTVCPPTAFGAGACLNGQCAPCGGG